MWLVNERCHSGEGPGLPEQVGGRSGQLPQEGVVGLGRRQPDPGIVGGYPLRAGGNPAEVELRDLGKVIGQPGHAQQDLPQARQIG